MVVKIDIHMKYKIFVSKYSVLDYILNSFSNLISKSCIFGTTYARLQQNLPLLISSIEDRPEDGHVEAEAFSRYTVQ
jgi:hypothetical protein